MHKKLLFAALFTISINAFAGSKPAVHQETTAIITPDVATGVLVTSRFGNDSNGDLVACPVSAVYDEYKNLCKQDGRNSWKYIKDIVPPGKTYSGFRFSGFGYYNTRVIEIYYK